MTTRQTCELINPNGLLFANVIAEIFELIRAVLVLDYKNIKEEASDVAYFFWNYFTIQTGITVPLFIGRTSARKFLKRLVVLVGVCNDLQIVFDYDSTRLGTNFWKPEKLFAVINANINLMITASDVVGLDDLNLPSPDITTLHERAMEIYGCINSSTWNDLSNAFIFAYSVNNVIARLFGRVLSHKILDIKDK